MLDNLLQGVNMRESEIEKYFVRRVRELGGIAYKFTSPSHRGVSDRIVCLPGGATWFVELKTKGGRVSPLQDVFRREVLSLGQRYALLASKEAVDDWSLLQRERSARGGMAARTDPSELASAGGC